MVSVLFVVFEACCFICCLSNPISNREGNSVSVLTKRHFLWAIPACLYTIANNLYFVVINISDSPITQQVIVFFLYSSLGVRVLRNCDRRFGKCLYSETTVILVDVFHLQIEWNSMGFSISVDIQCCFYSNC